MSAPACGGAAGVCFLMVSFLFCWAGGPSHLVQLWGQRERVERCCLFEGSPFLKQALGIPGPSFSFVMEGGGVAAAWAGVKPCPSLPTQTKDAMGIGSLLLPSPAFTAMCMCVCLRRWPCLAASLQDRPCAALKPRLAVLTAFDQGCVDCVPSCPCPPPLSHWQDGQVSQQAVAAAAPSFSQLLCVCVRLCVPMSDGPAVPLVHQAEGVDASVCCSVWV